ncbi:tetraspanin-21-like [Folsomia candida]|uniref:Tetraspanin-33 n=1 Tax=Folsomia candida TaxID=158441 RepID=A0A226CUX4_FOLCA|nr:tetraspanin-21-like [Folsomia candida]OXA36783.1 Tetraspanin-33 [Folsomia candida]
MTKHRVTSGAFKSHKCLWRLFLCAHLALLLFASGFLVGGFLLQWSESSSVGMFKLGVTTSLVHLCWGVAGGLAFAAVIGILAQTVWNRPCAWILYCTTLGGLALDQLSLGGSALGKASNMKTVNINLLKQMEYYVKDQPYNVTDESNISEGREREAEWDSIQQDYKCCGLSNYKDWQGVRFGRTSLTVPRSCCLPSEKKSDKYCNVNILPEHPRASSIIYTDGCLQKLVRVMHIMLQAVGFYSILLSLVQFGFVGGLRTS